MLNRKELGKNPVALSALTPLLLAFSPQDPSFDPPTLDLTLDNGEVQQLVIEVCIPGEANISMADVFLLADSTGSMGDEIAQVQADAALILNTLLGDPTIDFQVGVGDYKDFPSDDYAFQLAQPITDDAAALTNGINEWVAEGGYDIPEGQLYAFDRLVNDPAVGWRAGAKRIIVFFGDAPGHDPVCADISGLGYDITEASVITSLQGAGPGGTTVIGVNSEGGLNDAIDSYDYDPFCGSSLAPAGQADRIAAATGGLIEDIGNPAEVTTAILGAIETVLTQVDVSFAGTGGIGGLVSNLEPASHSVTLPNNPEEEVCVEFTVTFEGYCVGDPADADPSAHLALLFDGVPTLYGIPTDAHLEVCEDEDEGDELNYSIFAGVDVDVRASQVWGAIAAGNDLSVEACNLGIGVMDEDTDTMIAERHIHASIGNLEHGNVVAGSSFDIQPNFTLAGGTQAPRIESVVDWASSLNLITATTTALGAMAPTGTTAVHEDNLILSANSGLEIELFHVTAAELEAASEVRIEVAHGSAVVVNIEGGNLSPMQFGIRLVNVAPDMVLFNAYEASHVSLADVNFDGSLVAPAGDVSVTELDVAGQLVAGGDISLEAGRVLGQLYSANLGEVVPFMAGLSMQEPEDVLLQNLILSPNAFSDVTVARSSDAIGAPLSVSLNARTKLFRSEKIARVTIEGVTDLSRVNVDPSLGLEVHLLEEAPLTGDDVYFLEREGAPERGRGMILMDLFANDLAGSSGLDMSSFRITKKPSHGVVRYYEPAGKVWFAWDSSKWEEDSFEYQLLDGNGVASAPAEVQLIR